MKKPEILSPAGDMEKLQAAVLYGADAVYLAGTFFGMRTASANFSDEEMRKAVVYAHENNVKVYVTCKVLLPGNPKLPSASCNVKHTPPSTTLAPHI